MTPEERAELVRRYGYREPIGSADWQIAGGIIVVTVVAPLFGMYGLVFGSTAAERVRGVFMLAVGAMLCYWAYQRFRRPLAPADDGDFERELRYRHGYQGDSG